jgi:hypothetical protein
VIALVLSMWALLRWSNPAGPIDSVRAVQVNAPGETLARFIYSAVSPLTPKRAGTSGAPDSAWLAVSTANIVGPAAIRLHLYAHNGAGWSPPSNALSLFYGAKDTLYAGPGGNMPAPGWWRGPGLFGYAQAPGDATWPGWTHQELLQRTSAAAICRAYHYVALRGVRDSTLCVGQ